MDFQRNLPELERWRQVTNGPLTVVALGSLPILLLNFVSNRLSDTDRTFLFAVDLLVFAVFAVDYLVELTLVRQKMRYVRTEWLNALIVIAQLAALLPAFGVLGVLRAARGVRVASTLARVVGVATASSRRQGLTTLRQRAVRLAFGLAAMTWVTSAVAFTLAENVGEDRRVESFFDSLWWSAATITTVGYGDIYPVTATGRIIAVFTMVVGISTLAVVTARIAAFLVREPAS